MVCSLGRLGLQSTLVFASPESILRREKQPGFLSLCRGLSLALCCLVEQSWLVLNLWYIIGRHTHTHTILSSL